MQKLMLRINKSRPAIVRLLIAIVTFLMLFSMISVGVAPEKYDLRIGEVAKITITATEDVRDKLTTELMMESAERAVQRSYHYDEAVMPDVLKSLGAALAEAGALPLLRNGADGELIETATPAMIDRARDALRSAGADSPEHPLTDEDMHALIEADADTLAKLTGEIQKMVRDTLNGRLNEDKVEDTFVQFRRDLIASEYPAALVDAALDLTRAFLRPNMLLDEETTRANREKARDEVQPVLYMKGQNIVRSGEVVTAPQIAMLDALGLLKDRSVDLSLYLGIGILLIMLLLVIGVYTYTFEREIFGDPGKLMLLSVVCVLVTGMSMMFRLVSPYLMPVALGAILTTVLLKSRLAIITNLVLAVVAGMLASGKGALLSSTMFSVVLSAFVSGAICAVLIRGQRQRTSVLLAGFVAGIAGAVCTVAVAFISSANIENVLNIAGFSALSGVLSGVLSIGLQPALEWIFNLGTGSKLMDLSNPNQPLLRRLMIEAPGTYHHSMIVANMSEAAANAIGANGLLARVGSYYHDIGKLKRPMYFKENQINDNPHDRTDPRVSTAILTSHTRDGVEMAQRARIPQSIQEIIARHHGDTPVLYFYDKAVKQGGDVDIQDFRYEGPRPENPEAAIVMLADTIEAAARSMTDSTPEKLTNLIQRLVRSKVDDGQLDRCSLTFRDLNLICEAFLTVLSGVFHNRIEYPTIDIPERKRIDDAACEGAQCQHPKAPEHQPIATELPPESQPMPDPMESPQAEEFLEELPTADTTQQEEDES